MGFLLRVWGFGEGGDGVGGLGEVGRGLEGGEVDSGDWLVCDLSGAGVMLGLWVWYGILVRGTSNHPS